jgi:hypothetical protein
MNRDPCDLLVGTKGIEPLVPFIISVGYKDVHHWCTGMMRRL